MKTDEFWAIIERAWALVPGSDTARPLLTSTSACERDKAAAWTEKNMTTFIERLVDQLVALAGDGSSTKATKKELQDFYKITRDAIVTLDTECVIHAAAAVAFMLSDDGWLYHRAWVVAAGKDYYDIVLKTPSKMADCWCFRGEGMLYPAMQAHEKLYGKDLFSNDE